LSGETRHKQGATMTKGQRINIKKKIHEVLKQYDVNIAVNDVEKMWNEPHRFYHTFDNHLSDIINNIEVDVKNSIMSQSKYYRLMLAAIFHDIVYVPGAKYNEAESCAFLRSVATPSPTIDIACNLIMATKTQVAKTEDEKIFLRYDNSILDSRIVKLLKYEKQIAKEYQFFSYGDYLQGRIEFLKGAYVKNNNEALLALVEIIIQNLIVRHFKIEYNVYVYKGGKLNKKIVAEYLFTNPVTKKYIEGLIHPLVKTHIEEWIKKHNNETVFVFVPTMFETGFDAVMDVVINISSDVLSRANRVVDSRGCSLADFTNRVKQQMSEEERCMRSDYVVENNSSIEDFEKDIVKIIEIIKIERSLVDTIRESSAKDFYSEAVKLAKKLQ